MSDPPSSVESDETTEKMNEPSRSSGRTLSKVCSYSTVTLNQQLMTLFVVPYSFSQMERIGIVSGYFAIFVMLIIAVFVIFDGYECYSHGMFDGNIRIANIDLTSSGETDMSMDLTFNAWLQSRLHTMKIDAVNCISHIDTPSKLHLKMFDTTAMLSLAVKPKSLWSAWDGSTFRGHDAPIYSVNGRIAISHVSFINLRMMLTNDTMNVPSNNTHTLITECAIDGALQLFSVPMMSISIKKYALTNHKHFSFDQPTIDSINKVTTTDHRSLNVVNDIAFYLKSFLSKIPALGSSLAAISQSDYETLVNDFAASPSAIVDLVLSPLQNGRGVFSDNFDMAQVDFRYDLSIPPAYIPSFLVNVNVPPLTVRVSSGTRGSGWSWLVSTRPFIMDLSTRTSISATVGCGDTAGSCTLMTPVYGFASNAFSNLQDTFEFDMVGDDNVVYRALGRHTNISYSASLDYQVPASNVVNDMGLTSCLNVTVADHWRLKNACLMKQHGRSEVDVSFDIPSFDGTSGSYFGMSSAFTWTYAALSSKPTATPTTAPTSPPSMAPTMVPTQPTVTPSVTPTAFPTSVPTVKPTPTPSFTPTATPNVAHAVALFVIQVRLSPCFRFFLPIVFINLYFVFVLFHRRSEVSVKTTPLAALPSPRYSQMLWSRLNPIRHIPSHPPSSLLSSRSRMSCLVNTVAITSLVSDILLQFSTMLLSCPSSAAILRQVCTPALCRIFCEVGEAIHMFKCTVPALSWCNYRVHQPCHPHHAPRPSPLLTGHQSKGPQ